MEQGDFLVLLRNNRLEKIAEHFPTKAQVLSLSSQECIDKFGKFSGTVLFNRLSKFLSDQSANANTTLASATKASEINDSIDVNVITEKIGDLQLDGARVIEQGYRPDGSKRKEVRVRAGAKSEELDASIPVRKYEPGTGIITLSVEKEAVMAKALEADIKRAREQEKKRIEREFRMVRQIEEEYEQRESEKAEARLAKERKIAAREHIKHIPNKGGNRPHTGTRVTSRSAKPSHSELEPRIRGRGIARYVSETERASHRTSRRFQTGCYGFQNDDADDGRYQLQEEDFQP